MPHGWPFGLGNMNPIMAADDSQAAAPPQSYATRVHRSSSFSSFSSSNLDTEVISIYQTLLFSYLNLILFSCEILKFVIIPSYL